MRDETETATGRRSHVNLMGAKGGGGDSATSGGRGPAAARRPPGSPPRRGRGAKAPMGGASNHSPTPYSGPPSDVIEAFQEGHDAALAPAARAHQRHRLPHGRTPVSRRSDSKREHGHATLYTGLCWLVVCGRLRAHHGMVMCAYAQGGGAVTP